MGAVWPKRLWLSARKSLVTREKVVDINHCEQNRQWVTGGEKMRSEFRLREQKKEKRKKKSYVRTDRERKETESKGRRLELPTWCIG